MNDSIKEFKTSSLPLVAFLRYNGNEVKGITAISSHKVEFMFENIDRGLLYAFNTDKAKVEPKMYSTIMHQMTQSARRTLFLNK